MTWLFDPAQPKYLRLTVSVLLTSQLAVFVHQIIVAASRAASGAVVNVVLATAFLLGAIGLYRRVRWGRIISLVFVWGVVLVSFGAMAPFRVGDDLAAGIEPPSVTVLAIQLALASCYALWCAHILGKYKTQFRHAWF